jgi:hypothetical protein
MGALVSGLLKEPRGHSIVPADNAIDQAATASAAQPSLPKFLLDNGNANEMGSNAISVFRAGLFQSSPSSES